MQLQLNKTILFFLTTCALYGENTNYASLDIHTLTIPKESIFLNLSYLTLNSTVDFLNIRESTLSPSSKYNTAGDMDGLELGIMYGLSDNVMLSYKLTRQNIEYNGNNFINTKNEIFARYNTLQNQNSFLNSGLSLDVGFINNRLNDYYITNISDINSLSSKFNINESNGELIAHAEGAVAGDVVLKYYPWVGFEETYDNSLYLRALTGFHTTNGLYDFYIGVKRTRINNVLTANNELLEADSSNELFKNLARDETMFFAGTSLAYEISDYVIEFMYEYDYFQRESGLDYAKTNHIIDLNFVYKITKNASLYTGAKLMFQQLNGEIPYLYNEYSQEKYDRKYGYAKFGFLYHF